MPAQVAIAAYNGPDEVVIGGPAALVRRALEDLDAMGIASSPLAIPHGNHSPHVESMLEEFARVAETIQYSKPRLPFVSNQTGQIFGAGEIPDAAYWVRHARAAVRFADGISALARRGHRLFIEIGPTPTLCGLGAGCVPVGSSQWLPSLRRGRSEWETVLGSLAALYRRGVRVDWKGFDLDYPRRVVTLPGYPFERKRFWFETEAAASAAQSTAARWPAVIAAGSRTGEPGSNRLECAHVPRQAQCPRSPLDGLHHRRASLIGRLHSGRPGAGVRRLGEPFRSPPDLSSAHGTLAAPARRAGAASIS